MRIALYPSRWKAWSRGITEAPMIEALLWDVDGTLAETERDGHRVAFNQAFQALNIPWRWNEQRYGALLKISGGRERLLHDMRFQEDAPVDIGEQKLLAQRIHQLKNELYAGIVARGLLTLRDGVRELMKDCMRAKVRMGIVTTTSRCNVDVLLGTHFGADWASLFSTIICAEQAPRKKPHPQAYFLALQTLRVEPHLAIAIEDAPAGVSAAQAAGVPVIIAHSHYFPSVASERALATGGSLGDSKGWTPPSGMRTGRVGLEQINHWREGFACNQARDLG
jgi:HAD superfamily hydrolase (TIGR01509 family)